MVHKTPSERAMEFSSTKDLPIFEIVQSNNWLILTGTLLLGILIGCVITAVVSAKKEVVREVTSIRERVEKIPVKETVLKEVPVILEKPIIKEVPVIIEAPRIHTIEKPIPKAVNIPLEPEYLRIEFPLSVRYMLPRCIPVMVYYGYSNGIRRSSAQTICGAEDIYENQNTYERR